MNNILLGVLIISGIVISSAFAITSVSDVSIASTQSSEVDLQKKSENIRVFFDGEKIVLKNIGKYASDIAMFRFFDDSGKEIHRIVIPDGEKKFGTTLSVVKDTTLKSDNTHLQRHVTKSFTLDDLDINSLDGLDGELVTKLGRVFQIINNYDENNNKGTGDGQSMVDGMGIQTRIIQKEFSGEMIHGENFIGKREFLKPYIPVSTSTNYAAMVLQDDAGESYKIPKFYAEYSLHKDRLVDTTKTQNVLEYTDTRPLERDSKALPQSGGTAEGITVSKEGESVMSLHDISGRTLLLTGNAGNGIFKIITSDVDLMTSPINAYGYKRSVFVDGVNQIHLCMPGHISRDQYRQVLPCTDTITLEGGGNDSKHKVVFTYSHKTIQSGFDMSSCMSNSVCKEKYNTKITRHSFDIPFKILPKDGSVNVSLIPKKGVIAFEPPIEQHPSKWRPSDRYTVIEKRFDFYDTLPSIEILKLTGIFSRVIELPDNPKMYLYAENVGTAMNIKGVLHSSPTPLIINDLPKDTAYRIFFDDKIFASGVVPKSETISFDSPKNIAYTNGILKLYPEALSYSGKFSTVVFDKINHETIHIETEKDITYIVHAYAAIPVTGNVEITDVFLDGKLELKYLEDNYVTGDNLMIPIIPTYHDVRMKINGVDTITQFVNILGGTGINIADPAHNTITTKSDTEFTTSVESTAGTATYMIASSAGKAKAILTASVSGEAIITNTKTLKIVPPPPTDPNPDDPLTTWVEVYVNGDIQSINGNKKTEILFSNTPTTKHSSGISETSVSHTAHFIYPRISVSGTLSVPVETGDFVEFYFYTKIHAEGSIPSTPPNNLHTGSSSTALVTASLYSASIHTGM